MDPDLDGTAERFRALLGHGPGIAKGLRPRALPLRGPLPGLVQCCIAPGPISQAMHGTLKPSKIFGAILASAILLRIPGSSLA